MSNSPTIREQMISSGLIRAEQIGFEEWVESGFEKELGRVEILFPALGFGIIQPDRFRDRRLLLPKKVWEKLPGSPASLQPDSRVELSLKPQEFQKGMLPEVCSCWPLLPKGKR